MNRDEKEIRDLVATWIKATKEGDTEAVLTLMADDAVFLVPGQTPFGKEAFKTTAKDASSALLEIDGESKILEITVSGEWAFMLSHLTVKINSEGLIKMIRTGHTLTVLKKCEGRWLLFRDANLLVPASGFTNGN